MAVADVADDTLKYDNAHGRGRCRCFPPVPVPDDTGRDAGVSASGVARAGRSGAAREPEPIGSLHPPGLALSRRSRQRSPRSKRSCGGRKGLTVRPKREPPELVSAQLREHVHCGAHGDMKLAAG